MNVNDFAKNCVLRVLGNSHESSFTKSGATGSFRWVIESKVDSVEIKIWYVQDPINTAPRFSKVYNKKDL